MNPPARRFHVRPFPGQRSALHRTCEQAATVTDPDIVNRLVSHSEREVRRVLAQRSDLPPSVYERLAEDGDWRVRLHLLLWDNPLPAGVFHRLAADRVWLVRKAVPLNKHCPPGLVELLSADPNPWVRQSVVRSRLTTERALRRLADDPSRQVRDGFAHREFVEQFRKKLNI